MRALTIGTAGATATGGLGTTLAIAGCGDDTSTGSGGAGGGGGDGPSSTTGSAGGDGSTSSGGDGGQGGGTTGDGGAGGGTPVDPSTLADSGLIGFYQLGTDAEVSASFQRGREPAHPYTGGCEDDVVVGTCVLQRCAGEPGPDERELLLAGALTTSGLLTPVSISPGADSKYEWTGVSPLFDTAAELAASFAGGDVPAFTATIAAPSRITSVDPPFQDLALVRGSDVEVSWTVEGDGGELFLELITFDDEGMESVLCTFDPDAGAGVIPADLLPARSEGVAMAWTRNLRHVAVGSHDVTVQALHLAHFGEYSVTE